MLDGPRHVGESGEGVSDQDLSEQFRLRFWANVDRSAGDDGCWPWLRSRNSAGYGHVKLPGRIMRGAHRVAYVLGSGHPIPQGMFVCHHCDNPVCCNPSHLFIGTHQDNVDDKVAKGRQARGERMTAAKLLTAARGDRHGSKTHPEKWRRGADRPDARFSVDDVRAIRAEYALGGVTLQEIGARHGTAKSTVSRLVRRETYVDILD